MRQMAIALALGTSCVSSVYAQSTVTIYGTIDAAGRYVKNNSGGMYSLTNGGNLASNRLGFRGSEDLGDGLRADFTLETDVFPDTGTTTASAFFNRMSWVSLRSKTLGEVRLGRDYTPGHRTLAGYDPFGYIGVGAIVNLISSAQVAAIGSAFNNASGSNNTIARVSNSIAYYTPDFGGWYGALQIAAPEGSASTGPLGNSKYYGGRLGYNAGPISFSTIYQVTKNTNIAGESFKEFAAGGTYDFGVVKAELLYVAMDYVQSKFKLWQIGATAPFGVSVVRASYTVANQSGTAAAAFLGTPAGGSIADRDASQFALGYAYYLSKRTAIYANAALVMNKGSNAGFNVSGGPALTPGTDRKSQGVEFGVSHSF